MLYAFVLAVIIADYPDCLPDAAVIVEAPVTAEIAPAMVWGITGYTQACPSCPLEPQYGWVQAEPTIDQAARRLEKWRSLPADEVKRLAKIVDAPAVRKARAGHYSPGSCGMLGCGVHPGSWVWDDEENQAETDAKTVPWPSGRLRFFRWRR